MQSTIQSAASIDIAAASSRFHASLLGGAYWDDLAVAMRPELADCGSEHLDYTFDACIDEGFAAEGVDPRSDDGIKILRRWTDIRARTCASILRALPVIDGCVRAHRLIACDPGDLRPALGVFWTYDFDNWPDPYAPWSEGGREAPTLLFEAMIPIEAVDWQASCMARMDWYSGDCEAELRVIAGHQVRIISCSLLGRGTPMIIPDHDYTT